MTAFAERITELPQIYDAARGADVLASALKALREVPALAASAELLAAPKSAALLEAVFSASPYLAALAGRSPHLLLECLTRDPDTHLAEARAALAEDVAQASGQKEVMALLRQFKQRTRSADRRLPISAASGRRQIDTAGLERSGGCVGAGGGGILVPQGARSGAGHRAGGRGGLFRHRHGQARRHGAQLFERYRLHGVLRRRARRACRGCRAVVLLRPPDPRSRPSAAGAHRRRLRLSHRLAAAARSRRDPDRALHRRRPHLLRELRPELGAGRADQGAHRGRRRRSRRASSWTSSRPSSGANISTSPPSPTSTP